MVFTLDQLKDAAIDLPEAERVELAQFLVRSLDQHEIAAIRAEWMTEARRRLDEIKSGAVIGVPADNVLDKLLRAN